MLEHSIPHRTAPGMCPVNGIRDLIHWRTGCDWSNEFVHGLGQGGGFAYLRIKPANPPRQVYWGTATPRQHQYLAGLLGATYTELENRSFKTAWRKAQEAIEQGTPPIIGPVDMFYLPWYPGIYQRRHIPIHYLLLVGSDRNTAFVYDTGYPQLQELSLSELQAAWDVNVPGLGKRNRLVVLDLPGEIEATDTLIRKAIADECHMMLKPPISILGIPGMQKLAREIGGWPQELGEEISRRCLQQVSEYLNSPPSSEGNHLTAGRDLYNAFLQQAAEAAGLDFSEPISQFQVVLEIIPDIAQAIRVNDLSTAAEGFEQVAVAEKQAFNLLNKLVAEPG